MCTRMLARLVRTLALVSLLLMPLGMPAAAAPHGSAEHATMAEDCHDSMPRPEQGRDMTCAAGCAMLLPARFAQPFLPSLPIAPQHAPSGDPLISLPPETATPPPKLS